MENVNECARVLYIFYAGKIEVLVVNERFRWREELMEVIVKR